MSERKKDYFYHKAKAENFLARSVYKLQEIDQKHRLIRPGIQILDLGASPGSWSQYASAKVGEKGKVLGIDLNPVKVSLPNATFIVGDLRELTSLEVELQKAGLKPPVDLVMSDMAPKTTGIRVTDQARSQELCELAVQVADRWLKQGGHLLMKYFHSDGFDELRQALRQRYEKVDVIRPKSTRSESKEVFLLGLSKV